MKKSIKPGDLVMVIPPFVPQGCGIVTTAIRKVIGDFSKNGQIVKARYPNEVMWEVEPSVPCEAGYIACIGDYCLMPINGNNFEEEENIDKCINLQDS